MHIFCNNALFSPKNIFLKLFLNKTSNLLTENFPLNNMFPEEEKNFFHLWYGIRYIGCITMITFQASRWQGRTIWGICAAVLCHRQDKVPWLGISSSQDMCYVSDPLALGLGGSFSCQEMEGQGGWRWPFSTIRYLFVCQVQCWLCEYSYREQWCWKGWNTSAMGCSSSRVWLCQDHSCCQETGVTRKGKSYAFLTHS